MNEEQELIKVFKGMGLTESEAKEAARGRDRGPVGKPLKEASEPTEHLTDEEQKLMESFKTMGLSELAAKEAAKGRENLQPKRGTKAGKKPPTIIGKNVPLREGN